MSESHKGKFKSEETKKKISEAKKGIPKSEEHKRKISETMKGRKLSEETRKRISESNKGKNKGKIRSPEALINISNGQKGKVISKETRQKMSDSRKGEKSHWFGKSGELHPAWLGGLSYGSYCHKFNHKLKEQIREKYDRRCFLCNKPEKYNGNRRLSIHHVDYNKNQGCNEHKWRLIPLCGSCHSKTNGKRKYWENLILDVLQFAWNDELCNTFNLDL